MTTALRYVDRSQRGKLSFTGEQRLWFLHQVLTQAFEDISSGETREAAMITVHGRLTAHMEAVATEDAVLTHFEPELRESLPAALERYVFATRVEIADVTDEMGLVLLVGEDRRSALERLSLPVTVHAAASVGEPADHLWVERAALGDLVSSLEASDAEAMTEDELDVLRIRAGIPRWGREMDEKTFPQEVGIDESAVHYDKGCYLGQEAMAKIHFRGKVNRRLARLSASGAIEEGADLTLDGRRVGSITSAADGAGLALVRQTVEPGTKLAAGEVEIEVVS